MATYITGKGGYNVLCDICGWQLKNTEVRKRWDGLIVCEEDWEMRHPLDFYKTRNDVHLLPFTRSDNNGVDIGPPINPLTYTVMPPPYPADTPIDTSNNDNVALADIGKANFALADIGL